MSILVAVLGACIGSFLNVVIYRLPRGLSISRPRRSFCPSCEHMIAGYDNIPVLSYLLLRGRCRHCGASISIQYPIVELAAALLFVATYDVFVVGRWRLGVGHWPQDGALIAAHWILWAGLLAVAVMDIEAYHLDIRVTWVVAAAGILCHMLWTPESSAGWPRPMPATAAGSVAATIALGLTVLGAFARARRQSRASGGEADTGGAAADESERGHNRNAGDSDGGTPVSAPVSESETKGGTVTARSGSGGAGRRLARFLVIGFGTAAIVGYICWMNVAPFQDPRIPPTVSSIATVRVAAVVVVLMVLIIAASSVPRAADQEIIDTIEAESVSARRLALIESAWLSPAAAAGVAAFLAWGRLWPVSPEGGATVFDWAPLGQWRPLLGLATALSGWLIAGALGWMVRIVFTLAMGKEAFGVGDIHILAAAGAVIGWAAAVMGFFLSAVLALVGVAVFALRRQSRAIQFGPWLGLGLFVAAAAQDRIIDAMHLEWLLR